MSPRQYTMLHEFVNNGRVDLETLRSFNQLTLGSLIYRKWVKQTGEIFSITVEGRDAYYAYGTQNILRQSYAAAMSRYIKGKNAKFY